MAGSGILSVLSKRWSELSQVGVWGVAAVMPLLWKPPLLAPGIANDTWIPIAQYAVTIIFALIWVVLRRRFQRSFFAAAAVLLALAGLASTFQYTKVHAEWTCQYAKRGPVVIGEQLSPEGRRHAGRIGTSDCERLIEDFVGETDDLWPRSEMIERYVALGRWYIANLVLLATAMAMVLESFRARSMPGRQLDAPVPDVKEAVAAMGETDMAKGQKKSNKEARKPKKEVKKTIAANPSSKGVVKD